MPARVLRAGSKPRPTLGTTVHHPRLDIDALVAPLRADTLSGAAALGSRAASAVRRAVRRSGSDEVGELRELLAALITAILDAQPAMAPLVTLGRRVLCAAGETEGTSRLREGVESAVEAFEADLDEGGGRVADAARPLLTGARRILTLSASSTVRRSLEALAGPGAPEIVCLEGRPMLEGRRLATRLARRGLHTTLAVDAAGGALLARCDAVVVGADSIGDLGVVNKVGTRLLAAGARDGGVPLYVLTDATKLLPPGFPQPVDDDRPGDEVWESPGSVRIWNRYFEATPLDRVERIVLGDGALDPAEVSERRDALDVPERLRAWARKRSG